MRSCDNCGKMKPADECVYPGASTLCSAECATAAGALRGSGGYRVPTDSTPRAEAASLTDALGEPAARELCDILDRAGMTAAPIRDGEWDEVRGGVDDFAEDRRVCDEAPARPWRIPVTYDRLDEEWADISGGSGKAHIGEARLDVAVFCARARTRWPAALDRIKELGSDLRASQQATADAEALVISHEGRIGELEAARERDHIGISMAKGYISAERSDDAAAILETLLKGDS